MSFKAFTGLLSKTASHWNDCNAPRLGAALAYYTLLSVAPLIILFVAICGLIFGTKGAEQQLLRETAAVIGRGGAGVLKTLIENSHHPKAGIIATAIAIVTLLFGASGVFVELRDSLDTIWNASRQASAGWRGLLWQRVLAFGMVLGLGLLLLLSLCVSAAFAIIQKYFTGFIPLHAAIFGEVLNFVISVCAIGLLFALVFKFVPAVPIDWRDVAIGAAATSILFMIGKSLLAIFLTTAGVGSTYGAAGSLVAFVVWVYYSAQIFLFGAIFTRVYADRLGSRQAAPEPTQKTQSAGSTR